MVANTSDESPSQPSIAGTSFNPDLGAGGLHTRLSDDFGEEDVLEMGGDPFFLSNDECEDDVLVDDPAHYESFILLVIRPYAIIEICLARQLRLQI